MANKTQTITISSILGGMSPTSHFASGSQFRSSMGIDPAQPIDDADTAYSTVASGLLRPVASEKFSGTTIGSAPLWMVTTPKSSNVYVLDALGSAYTIDSTISTVTAISDAGELSNGIGNGADYYDNYVYFAKNTTIARIGPLNGATTINGDYWVTTLAKTALVNTEYPSTYKNGLQIPNHPLHRHSDGRLYIGDVVGNQGYIHYIATTKTTVEGDTNNSSTYLALGLGYGLWPTSIESYGSDISIALYEGSNTGLRQKNAKMAFWDTTSTNANKIVWVEFPDAIITAQRNINGVLYVASGNFQTRGFRITKFIGGYSYQEVFYSETGEPPLQGAFDGILNRLVFGTNTNVPESDGVVHSIGLQKTALGSGLFNVMRATGGNSSTTVTSLAFADSTENGFYVPIIGWTNGTSHGLDKQGSTYSNAPSVFWSQMFRIGQPFKITKINIPLAQAVGANMTVTPKIYVDDGANSSTLTIINNTNYPGKYNVMQEVGVTGQHNFWLELKWTGSALCTVGLPITIEWELIPE